METLTTVINFVGGGGSGQQDAVNAAASGTSTTADPLFVVLAVLAALITFAAGLFVYSKYKNKASADAFGAHARPSVANARFERTNSRKKPILVLLVVSLCVSLFAAGVAAFGHNSALAASGTNDQNATGDLSMTKITGTIDEATQQITFNEATITNSGSRDFLFDQVSITKFEGINDNDCTWTLTSQGTQLYSGQAPTSAQPWVIENALSIPANGGSITVSIAQSGLTYSTMLTMVDRDVLTINLDMTHKASEEEKQEAVTAITAAEKSASDTVATFVDLSEAEKQEFNKQLATLKATAEAEIAKASKTSKVLETTEQYVKDADAVAKAALEKAKANATETVDTQAQDVNTFINSLGQLTDTQKQTYIADINDKLKTAKDGINKASDNASIKKAKDDLTTQLANIKAEADAANKAAAQKMITDEVTVLIKTIGNLDSNLFSDTAKSAYSTRLTDAKNAAETVLKKSGVTPQEIDEAMIAFKTATSSINKDISDMNSQKPTANTTLSKAKTDADAAIDGCHNLTKTARDSYKTEIEGLYSTGVTGSKNSTTSAELAGVVKTAADGISARVTAAKDANSKAYWTLKYDFNGQEGTKTVTTTAQWETNLGVTLEIPTATGYTFGGWYKENTCENKWNIDSDKICEQASYTQCIDQDNCAVILYAKWIVKYHRVIFNANGHGTAPAEIPSQAYGTTFNNPGTITGVTGYTHDGKWFRDPECTTEWNFATDTMPDRDLTLYAHWTIKLISLTKTYNSQTVWFVPAFADTKASTYLKDIKFYNASKDEITEITTAISDNSLTMNKLYTEYLKSTNENLKPAYVYNSGNKVTFYGVLNESWNNVFNSSTTSGTATGYNTSSNFYANFLDDDAGIGTVYFTGPKKSPTTATGTTWTTGSGKCPQLNGVYYSNKRSGTTTFYEAYGASSGGVLSSYSYIPWSSCADNSSLAYLWDVSNGNWTRYGRGGHGIGVVVSQAF